MRKYGELPEESYLEPHGRLEIQRFFASRTTVGLAVRFGAKYYNDSAASSVWETLNLPSTSQVAARLNIAKGVSDRVAVRGWVDSRWNLSDFPRYVADDVFDSPLLDGHAHEGIDGFAAVKYLGPARVWCEAGVTGGDHDSPIAAYTYAGMFISSSLTWRF